MSLPKLTINSMYVSSFLAGITDSYNPCSIGVLIVSLTILLGLKKPKLIGIFGISYLSAIFATYFIIGIGALKAFHLFGVHGFFGYASGIVLILVGLIHLFPHLFPNNSITRWMRSCHLPSSLSDHLDKGIFVAGVILGFLIGLCTIPCAGGIYLGVISLLAIKNTYIQGIANLFFFNIGFILPLIIIFFASTREPILRKIQQWNAKIARYGIVATSCIMILMGIVIIWITKF